MIIMFQQNSYGNMYRFQKQYFFWNGFWEQNIVKNACN